MSALQNTSADKKDDTSADKNPDAKKYFWPNAQSEHDADRDKHDAKVEEGFLSNGPTDAQVIAKLERAEEIRHGERLGRRPALANPQVEFGGGPFYHADQIKLANEVLRILKKRHEKISRTPRADVMADFKKLSTRAGYMGPQPIMGSDGIMKENWFGGGDAGSWQPWTGGDCPVGKNDIVHYKTRGGKGSVFSKRAGELHWGNDGHESDDIISYSR